MPYRPRMTNKEYLVEKKRLYEVDSQIAELRKQIKLIRKNSENSRIRVVRYESKKYKSRMTNEEYLKEKAELKETYSQITELQQQIKLLRENSQKLRNRITWYEREDQQPMSEEERFGNSDAVKLFGKRAKDLTSNEKKELKRIQTQRCRAKRKAKETRARYKVDNK